MNKFIASVGLVALGAANVQAQNQTPVNGPASKWWDVQATVRGFYDDNINSVRHPGHSDRVWGGEITPRVGISLGNEQTTFTADYTYAFLYYDHRPAGNTEKYDQNHTFNAALSHAFNERYSIRVKNSFVIGQEPDALRHDAAFHTPFRVAGDNIVDFGGIVFNAELTPILGLEAGYDFAWFDYKDSFSGIGKNVDFDTGAISPSLSGSLDRVEQTPHISLLWHVQPDTTASVGYRFQQVNYTADEPILGALATGGGSAPGVSDFVRSDIRDNRSHTLYVGVDHQFRPDFYGSVQAGASYYDYYNLDQTSWGPYARLALTYVYMQESSIQAGYQQGRSATDVVGGSGGATVAADLVRDAETSVVFVNVRQRIVPKLFANLNGSYQHSTFKGGGTFDDETENYFEFGANLEYQINHHFSVHGGYDFNRLDSDIGGRTYSRNKVYIGATASY